MPYRCCLQSLFNQYFCNYLLSNYCTFGHKIWISKLTDLLTLKHRIPRKRYDTHTSSSTSPESYPCPHLFAWQLLLFNITNYTLAEAAKQAEIKRRTPSCHPTCTSLVKTAAPDLGMLWMDSLNILRWWLARKLHNAKHERTRTSPYALITLIITCRGLIRI